MNQILAELILVKAHLGNKSWNKETSPFLLGFRKSPSVSQMVNGKAVLKRPSFRVNQYALVNLEKTSIALQQVLHFLETLAHDKKDACHILLISTGNSQGSGKVQVNFPHMFSQVLSSQQKEGGFHTSPKVSFTQDKWVGGTLTNWKQIVQSISIYSQFKDKFDLFLTKHNIQFPMYQKYDKRYQGLHPMMSSLPDVVIMTNPEENEIALREAHLLKIPVIGFVNSDTQLKYIRYIDYVIPGNNKSSSFIYLCLNLCITLLMKKTASMHR
jgi:ribosomal protein S2